MVRCSQLFDFFAFFDCFISDVYDEAEDEEDAEKEEADDGDDDSVVFDVVGLAEHGLLVCVTGTCLVS